MSGRSYGRSTGWAFVNNEIVRVRVGFCGRGINEIQVKLYAGGDYFFIDRSLTARTKGQAIAKFLTK